MEAKILSALNAFEESLEEFYQSYCKTFQKNELFRAGYMCLSMLLDNVLSEKQRVACIYILLKNEANVFTQSVLETIKRETYEEALYQAVLRKDEDVKRKMYDDVIKMEFEGESSEPRKVRTVRPVINTGSSDPNSVVLGKFEPEFLRPLPPFLPPDEAIWLNPGHCPEVIWDWEMGAEKGSAMEIREQLQRALRNGLTPAQSNKLIEALNEDPKLVHKCGITPKKLPELVENNPAIAIEVLLKLVSSAQIQEYFQELMGMNLSVQSMEVINKLATQVDLPSEFLHVYINGCINACESMADKYMQSRLVRLFCVFLNSLLRHEIVNVKEMYVELSAFCVNFSRIPEASNLFKMLKSEETNPNA